MAKPGQNIGNKNAAVKGRRKRVAFSVSLSGEQLEKVIKRLQEQGWQDVTDQMIAEQARDWLKDWIDGL